VCYPINYEKEAVGTFPFYSILVCDFQKSIIPLNDVWEITMDKDILRILWVFIKQSYLLIPTLLTAPLDFLERWFKVIYEPPQYAFPVLLVLGIGIATIRSDKQHTSTTLLNHKERVVRSALSLHRSKREFQYLSHLLPALAVLSRSQKDNHWNETVPRL